MRGIPRLSAALALCLAGPALAQEATGRDESSDIICLAVARGWGGTIDDLVHIRERPVPESFSRQNEDRGCAGFQLIRETLVNWHLAYGDEQTVTKALAYLERWATGGKPVRTKLSAQDQADRNLAESYRFVAMEYARAADFYSSPALLAKARRFAEPSLAVAIELRTPQADGQPRPGYDDYPDRLARDLDLRLAVARARIGGTPADFAAAREAFARNDDPNFDTAGEQAYRNGDDFCDIGDASYLAAWKEACDEANFDRRALAYWRYRALFSLAAKAAGVEGMNRQGDQWDGDTAIRLIEGRARDEGPGLPEAYFSNDGFAITEILFAKAESQYAKARRNLASETNEGRVEATQDARHALELAWLSAIYVQGVDHPGWQRRIGQRYIEISEFIARHEGADEPVWPQHARRLAWFRTILPRLDAMARGEGSVEARPGQ